MIRQPRTVRTAPTAGRRSGSPAVRTLEPKSLTASPVRSACSPPHTGHPQRADWFGAPVSARRPAALPSLIAMLVMLALADSGCRPRHEMPTRPSATAQFGQRESTAPEEKADGTVQDQRETWDAVFLNTRKIGYAHTVYQTLLQDDGSTMRRTHMLTELTIPRFTESTSVRTAMMSLETPEGAVRRFRVETSMGAAPVVVEGTYQAGNMQLVTTTPGKELERSMPWDDTTGGLFALEQSLRAQPMQPREQRQLSMLMPGISGVQVVKNELEAQDREEIDLLEGSQTLLRIQVRTLMGDQPVESVCWTSDSGDILKSTVPALQQTMYRTTQERARAPEEGGDYDLGMDSVVRLDTPLPHPHELTRAEYEVALSQRDPTEIFTAGGSQKVTKIDATRALLTVVAVRPDSLLSGAPEAPPQADDLAAGNLIQADDPEVIQLAREVVGEESDPWRKCVALENAACQLIQEKNYGQGFATAAEVVRSREGDCTEHAVLLAALCRAEKIPARVVLGLVYSPSHQGFAFHMWNEAWIEDRWIPLDATLGRGGIGAGHIKISHSDLTGDGSENAVLSVLTVINQLSIELRDFEPR